MKDYMDLGPAPCGEMCAQVGTPEYDQQSTVELKEYKAQLLRMIKEAGKTIPDGCSIYSKGYQHDFGRYYEITCSYDTSLEDAIAFAFWMEANIPECWDEIAKKNLGVGNG